jgi:hypothetical protein
VKARSMEAGYCAVVRGLDWPSCVLGRLRGKERRHCACHCGGGDHAEETAARNVRRHVGSPPFLGTATPPLYARVWKTRKIRSAVS